MHVVGLLGAPKDEDANVEGSFINFAIVVATELLVVTSMSHDGGGYLFFKVGSVDLRRRRRYVI
jgi:hypothetical protein